MLKTTRGINNFVWDSSYVIWHNFIIGSTDAKLTLITTATNEKATDIIDKRGMV